MTCADARQFILTADPSALRSSSDLGFRQHIAGCADCAAAARHVVADVDRLRAALIARGSRAVPVRPRRSTTKRVAMTLVPIALAAELAAFAFLGSRDTVNPLLDKPVMMDDTVSMLHPVVTHVDTGEVTIAPAPVKKASKKTPVVAAKDSAEDAADSTKRSSGPSEFISTEEMGQLQVTPASRRQRVAVIGTSNPKITVIWLSKVDSL